MKDGKMASQGELNYCLRRVIYDMMVAARAAHSLSIDQNDFSCKEMAKMAGLIMARNLNDFLFFVPDKPKEDDINVLDFCIDNWHPSPKAKLRPDTKNRINKIACHIVAHRQDVFMDDEKTKEFMLPLIKECCSFVQQCLAENKAEYTGNASKYVCQLNGILVKLELPLLPKQ